MTADDANRYIGLPWRFGARGPDAYDCWGLLHECRARHFGGGVPDTVLGQAAKRLYSRKLKSGEWEVVDLPAHGDGVLLRAGNDPHVGIYLDLDGGGVLHALEGCGVVFTPMRGLVSLGYSNPKFHRFHA
ncbi:NlpC/P60 family protein [Orrella sp. JC864]|uniref:NlpC/P60 family protein n=1 Tax=Orrella sp. JC864 TaxID=3120298 RepID=UPI00300B8D19